MSTNVMLGEMIRNNPPKVFNRWRKDHPTMEVNLSGQSFCHLKDLNLIAADLSHIVMECDENGGRIEGCDLSYSDMTGMKLDGVLFLPRKLRDAILPAEWLAEAKANFLLLCEHELVREGGVTALREALMSGGVGQYYEGNPGCILTILARGARMTLKEMVRATGHHQNFDNPLEQLGSAIRADDTEHDNPCVAHLLEWCDEIRVHETAKG